MSKSPYLDWDSHTAGKVVDSDEYAFHVGAITTFKLHAKSRFAAELAYRDLQIKEKDKRIAELEKKADALVTTMRSHPMSWPLIEFEELTAVLEKK